MQDNGLAIQNLPGFPRGLVNQESAGERYQGGWLTGFHLPLKRKQKTPQEPKMLLLFLEEQLIFVSSQIKTRSCVLPTFKILRKKYPDTFADNICECKEREIDGSGLH